MSTAFEAEMREKAKQYGTGWNPNNHVNLSRSFEEGARAALSSALVATLVKHLQVLRNEVTGTLKAHEVAIGYDHGNSNWRCLEIALEQAEQTLQNYHTEVSKK
jgi:hypothetical protein